MEIKVVVLGSSGSAPTKERGLPSVALVYNGDVFLFDCGEGTQVQMLKYGINGFRVKAVFISHAHGDHIIGLAGFLRTLGLNNRLTPLDIYVPKGHESVIKALVSFDRAVLNYDIRIHGIQKGLVYSTDKFAVTAFPLRHNISTYGYVFKENDRVHFLKERCDRLGIKGTMYSELEKKGSIRIGKRTVHIGDVTTPSPGKRVVYATDTRPVSETIKNAANADLLIHESSYADSEKELAAERMHSSASEAARIAKAAKAKMLLLTHISARYKSADQIERDARKTFKNTIVAKDGYTVTV